MYLAIHVPEFLSQLVSVLVGGANLRRPLVLDLAEMKMHLLHPHLQLCLILLQPIVLQLVVSQFSLVVSQDPGDLLLLLVLFLP